MYQTGAPGNIASFHILKEISPFFSILVEKSLILLLFIELPWINCASRQATLSLLISIVKMAKGSMVWASIQKSDQLSEFILISGL